MMSKYRYNTYWQLLLPNMISLINIIPNILAHSLLTFMPSSPGGQVRAGEVRGARRGAGRPPVAAVQPPVRPLRRHPHALQPVLEPGRPHRGLGCIIYPNYLNFFYGPKTLCVHVREPIES